MLVSLNVKNFAIIDNIQIDFNNGMSVITGETGAGKSLIIDAIGLLLGKRAQSDLIRHGENKASITGVFSNYSPELIDVLNDLDIEFDESDNLIIKREIYANGKSICKVNNEIISLNDLNKIGDLIGDIHSQEDTFGLINPKNYLSFLKTNEIDSLVLEYKEKLKEYKNANNEYLKKLNENNEIKLKKDFIEYKYKELKLAKLSVSEEEDLRNEEKYLSNYNTILDNLTKFKEIYNDKNALDLIYESLNYLSKLKEFDDSYNDLYNSLQESYYNIESIIDNPLFKNKNDDYDESRLDEINARLGIYSDLKRKYKKTTSEIIEYKQELEDNLNLIENFDDIIKELKDKSDKLYEETLDIALKIRDKRMMFAFDLSEEIMNTLSDLELKNTMFDVKFNEIDENNIQFNKDGIDNVDFLVTFNKGEAMKSLSKVASGGELSRFMLAMKTVLGDSLPQQTKIFDEIDSGVSGLVAHSIALKIKEISKKSQVLCITHLPQVASVGDTHIKISKKVLDNRTFTVIDELNQESRINEIASMISNGNVSDASINLAKELLNK